MTDISPQHAAAMEAAQLAANSLGKKALTIVVLVVWDPKFSPEADVSTIGMITGKVAPQNARSFGESIWSLPTRVREWVDAIGQAAEKQNRAN